VAAVFSLPMFDFLKKRRPEDEEPGAGPEDGPRPGPADGGGSVSADPGAVDSSGERAPPAADARLSDLLSSVFAEHEQEEAHDRLLQQLAFFRRSLRHMVVFLEQTTDLGHSAEARSTLEAVLDSISDLHDRLVATYELLPSSVAPATPEMPFEEAGLGGALEDEPTPERETRLETLHLELEGLCDEVQAIREGLVDDPALKGLLDQLGGPPREKAVGELREMCVCLNELVERCVEMLAKIPGAEEAAPPDGFGAEAPVPAAPPPSIFPPIQLAPLAPTTPSVPLPQAPLVPSGGKARPSPPLGAETLPPAGAMRASVSPAPSAPRASFPAPVAPVASPPFSGAQTLPPLGAPAPSVDAPFPFAPVAPGGPSPFSGAQTLPPAGAPVSSPAASATPAPEPTGLELARGAPDLGPGPSQEPPGPDGAHQSEEEAVHHLQSFFNDHSPEGTLLRADEPEFARMVRQLLAIVCPEAELSDSKLGMRTKALRDTFALRKKLHNRLTLTEFKAFFGVTG